MVVTKWEDPAADQGARRCSPQPPEIAALLNDPESALNDPDDARRNRAVEVLGLAGGEKGSWRLLPVLAHDNPKARKAAASALSRAGAHIAGTAALTALSSGPHAAREAAAEALGVMGDKVIPDLAALLESDDQEGAAGAARALEAALRDVDGERRKRSARVLGRVGGPATAQTIGPLLLDLDWRVRRAAIEVLTLIGTPAAVHAAAAFRSGDGPGREAATTVLCNLGDAAVPEVVPMLKADDEILRRAVADLLERLSDAGSATACSVVSTELRVPELEATIMVKRTRSMQETTTPPADEQLYAEVLTDRSAHGLMREAAARELLVADERAFPHLEAMLGSSDRRARSLAERTLADLGDKGRERVRAYADKQGSKAYTDVLWGLGRPEGSAHPTANEVCALLSNPSPHVRAAAADVLGHIGTAAEPYVHELVASLRDPEPAVHDSVAFALWCIGDASALPVKELLSDSDPAIAARAAYVLARLGAPATLHAASCLLDRFGHTSSSCATTLARAAVCNDEFDRAATAAIAVMLQDNDDQVRHAAAEALRELSEADVPRGSDLTCELESVGLFELIQTLAPAPPLLPQKARYCPSPLDTTLMQTGSVGLTRCINTTEHTQFYPQMREEQAVALLIEPKMLIDPQKRCAAAKSLAVMFNKGGADHSREVAVLLRDHDAETRRVAVEVLGKMRGGGNPAQYADGVALLLRDPEGAVRSTAAIALAQMGGFGARHAADVADRLADSDGDVRDAAVWALGQMCMPAGAAQASVYLRDTRTEVRLSAANAFREMGLAGAAHVSCVAPLLADGATHVRRAATEALGQMGESGAPHAVELLEHPEAHVRENAVHVLGRLGGAGSVVTVALLNHREVHVRCAALAALEAMGEAAAEHAHAVACVIDRPRVPTPGAAQDKWPVRLGVARALRQMGLAAAPFAPKVSLLLKDREAEVRAAAATTLARLVAHGAKERVRG